MGLVQVTGKGFLNNRGTSRSRDANLKAFIGEAFLQKKIVIQDGYIYKEVKPPPPPFPPEIPDRYVIVKEVCHPCV